MIVLDPKKRYSAEQVLEHSWFGSYKEHSTKGDISGSSKNVLESIQNFHCDSKLKLTCLYMLAKMIKKKELRELIKEFELIDEAQDGYISFHELKEVLGNSNFEISNSEIKNIISK